MAFDDLVRAGVALADTLTSSLQANVAHSAWTGQDGFGTPTYSASVNRLAIIEQRQRLHTLPNGQTIMTIAKISIIRAISANGASGRTEPIDTRDKFVLPDGTTGPVVDVAGLIDPDTNKPYLVEIWLGA